ncbi:unnamed protein product, partial [Amoebophrya sp. A120]
KVGNFLSARAPLHSALDNHKDEDNKPSKGGGAVKNFKWKTIGERLSNATEVPPAKLLVKKAKQENCQLVRKMLKDENGVPTLGDHGEFIYVYMKGNKRVDEAPTGGPNDDILGRQKSSDSAATGTPKGALAMKKKPKASAKKKLNPLNVKAEGEMGVVIDDGNNAFVGEEELLEEGEDEQEAALGFAGIEQEDNTTKVKIVLEEGDEKSSEPGAFFPDSSKAPGREDQQLQKTGSQKLSIVPIEVPDKKPSVLEKLATIDFDTDFVTQETDENHVEQGKLSTPRAHVEHG